MGVVRGRQAGPDVQELPDALSSQELHHLLEERATPAPRAGCRHDLDELIGRGPAVGEVVLPAQ
jgi:hypothetical protein